MIQIRALTPEDAAAFWQFRLKALETEPSAFGESAEEHRTRTIEFVAERLRPRPDQFVIAAFDGDALVGTAGFGRYSGLKEKHKGRVWGVYVDQVCRGQGVGRALMQELLARARLVEAIEQAILTVASTQPVARRLYESLGFESFGREPCALRVAGQCVDEDYMILRL